MATNENNPCTCTTPEYTIILNQQGPSGRQGVTGQDGFSPIIAVGTNTRDTYVLTITTADGVITTPNLISEPIPSGGINGQVLTNFGNDVYGWGTLPNATTESQGVVYLSTDEEFQPDEEGNVDDSTACTPQSVVNYINTLDLGSLENIKDTDSGVAITDVDSGLTYPNTINIATKTEDEPYSYIECKSSGSSLSSGIKFDLDNLTLMGGNLNSTTTSNSGGIKLSFETSSLNPSIIINEPVFLKGKQEASNVVTDLLAFDYTHTTGTTNNFKSNGFFIFDSQSSYTGRFTTNGILFSVGDEPSIKFTTSTANNGVWTDNVNATVLTDKTGIQYKALTSTEYAELPTKSDSTIYRLTDTNEVYLGSIKLTGGGNVVAGMYAGTHAGGQNTGHVGTNTVSTYDPPTT